MLNVSLTQLQYLVAVDNHRHFVAAAAHCNVTQPTLSMQVRKAEEQLGVMIFDRTRQPVVATDVGVPLLQQARAILREAGRLEEIVQAHRGTLGGELRLGIIPTLAPYLLPRFVGDFHRRYPSVALQLHEMATAEMVSHLATDQLDAGLAVTPLLEAGLREQPLFYEPLWLYGEAEGGLPTADVTLSELKGRRLWLLAEGHCFRNQVLNLCSPERSPEGFQYESGSLETLVRLVDVEGGSTLLPELATADLRTSQRRRLRPIESRPVREVSLVYSRHFVKERLLRALAEVVRAAVPERLRQAPPETVVRVQTAAPLPG